MIFIINKAKLNNYTNQGRCIQNVSKKTFDRLQLRFTVGMS